MSKVPCHKAASVIKCTFAKKFIFNYNKDIAEIMSNSNQKNRRVSFFINSNNVIYAVSSQYHNNIFVRRIGGCKTDILL